MDETAMGTIVTLEYAASADFVLVELKISKGYTFIAPASVVLSEKGGYEIQFIGNTLVMSEDGYGKTWRCWELREPSKVDRDRVPWE